MKLSYRLFAQIQGNTLWVFIRRERWVWGHNLLLLRLSSEGRPPPSDEDKVVVAIVEFEFEFLLMVVGFLGDRASAFNVSLLAFVSPSPSPILSLFSIWV